MEIELRDAKPGIFLEIMLSGGQPYHVRLRGRSDTGHPVLRALGAQVRRRVCAALEVDASLGRGTWSLSIWEPQRLSEADRLLGLVIDAAGALAELPRESIDRAVVDFHPDPGLRLRQLSEAIAEGRADLDWLSALCWDEIPEIALAAAAEAGECGRERLNMLLDDPYVAERAALALSRLPRGPASQRIELLLLSGAEDSDIEAIDALGRFGSARVLPVLHRLSVQTLGLSDAARHARAAIDAIYAREGRPGALSLAPREAGALGVSRGGPLTARDPR